MKGNDNAGGVRIDKWLWAVRLFKTRSLAADACRKGRISRLTQNLKPANEVHVGDVVSVRRPPVTYSFRVLQIAQNRMGAKLVPEFMENITPQDQLDILTMQKYGVNGLRDRGAGRPTKRERRHLMDFVDDGSSSPLDPEADLPGFDPSAFGDDDDDDNNSD